MSDANLGIIILCAAAALIIGGGIGFLIGSRSGKEKERIEELEEQLETAMKDMEVYRVQVNAHFKKTSELFHNMTDSYKAVYMHLADGSQSLCSAESAMLRPADNGFLALSHEEKEKTRNEENSRLGPKKPLAPEENAASPETESHEFKEDQAAMPEDDLHRETVKEPEGFVNLETEEFYEREEHAQVDKKAETEEFAEQEEYARVDEKTETEEFAEQEEYARVDEKAETSDASFQQETDALKEKRESLV